MHRKWEDIYVTPGSLASDRLPGPLRSSRRDLRPDMLAVALCKAADVLHVKGDHNQRIGSPQIPWVALFQAEPAFVCAQLIAFNVRDAAFEFDRAMERDSAAASLLISDLAKRLTGWISSLPKDHPSQFSKQMQQLNAEADLEARLAHLTRVNPVGILRAIRSINPAMMVMGADALTQARALETAFRSTHALLRNAVETLRPHALSAFEKRIVSGDIEPALGLLIAELRTASIVDATLNDVTDRIVHYYYGDIIGQTPAQASPERVLLHLDSGRQSLFVPEKSTLTARKPDNTVQSFATDAPVHISSAQLGRVATLTYETDPNISFNAELGGITGVHATHWEPALQPYPIQKQHSSSDRGLFTVGNTIALDMGLDISSPMLFLEQGTRRIDVFLQMKRAAMLPAAYTAGAAAVSDTEVVLALHSDPVLVQSFLAGKLEVSAQTLAAKSIQYISDQAQGLSLMGVYAYLATLVADAAQLRVLLGRIITLCLVENVPFPTGVFHRVLLEKVSAHKQAMSGAIRSAAQGNGLLGSMILDLFSGDPDAPTGLTPGDLFQKLLGDAFDIKLSTAEGPIPATVSQILPSGVAGEPGVRLSLMLAPGVAALTPRNGDEAPTLSLRYAENPRICPISFFERYTLVAIDFEVEAKGMRKVMAWSDDGPVVTDQTFMPFGARPQDGATFLVASPEMARKAVSHVEVDLTWADMPDPIGGFSAHYAAYVGKPKAPDPQLSVTYLSGDGWKPVTSAPVPLFATLPVTAELTEERCLSGPIQGHSVQASGRINLANFASRQSLRAGAVRLTLSGTAGGFLAEQYPLALVDAMRPRLLPFKERKIPPAPFVPKIDAFALSYTAKSSIEINAPDAAAPGEKIEQISPFGRVEVFPNRMLREIGLFPARLGFGHLFMQLVGDQATGPVSLLFNMTESGHLRLVPRPNPLKWYYLALQGWVELPDTAISSDTTSGLMRSGLLMIDLPDDAAHHSAEMPQGGVWIAAVATESGLGSFPALSGLKTNGTWATCTDGTYHDMAQSRVWAFDPAQAGIGTITETPTSAEVRPPEHRAAYLARVGERLRHRKRAITPWDVERMVLDAFPEVWMVKCLPGLHRTTPNPAPGQATVVVVRHAPEVSSVQMLDVSTLERIRDYINEHAPGFARIDVVNPTFDRLHVRAKLAFDPFRDDGAMAQRLQSELRRYLSVWTAPETLGRFGWSLNLKMLNAFINDLEYVRGVTDFSVLHLAADDDGAHVLLDSAQDDWRGAIAPVVRGSRPWSLPLSASEHALTVVDATRKETSIQSGIGRLSVGNTLIVGQRIPS